MNSCYYCGTVLSNKNRTGEHVLPNAIGGRLVSYKLLCRDCNILLGGKVDVELGRRFEEVMVSLGIDRDRKKRPIKIRDTNELREELTKEKQEALLLKAIAKIAINVYLHFGGDVKYIGSPLAIIKDMQLNDQHIHSYDPSPKERPLHSVTIKGSKQQKLLYAYIVLFSEHSFIADLNEQYSGDELSYTYCFDLSTGKSIEKDVPVCYEGRERYMDKIGE